MFAVRPDIDYGAFIVLTQEHHRKLMSCIQWSIQYFGMWVNTAFHG